MDAKKIHEQRRLILIRLRDYLHRALGQIRRERMQGDNGRRVGGAKRAVDEPTAPPTYAAVLLLGGSETAGAAGQPQPADEVVGAQQPIHLLVALARRE